MSEPMSEKDKDTNKPVTDAEATEAKGDDPKAEADEAKAKADEAKAEADADAGWDDDDVDHHEEERDEASAEVDDDGDTDTDDDGSDEVDDHAATQRMAPAGDGSDDIRSYAAPPSDGPLWGLMAEFSTPGELVEGAKVVRDAGFSKWDSYSPFPVHGIDPAMGIKLTILPLVVFAAGIAGLAGGLGLQWWVNAYDWPWFVSGKPFWSIPANIPIAFETTVLVSGITAFFAMWAFNKLPQHWHPLFRNDRFRKVTDDGFFIAVEAADEKFDEAQTRALLESAGAVHIEDVRLDPDPDKKRMPRPVVAFIIMTSCLALVPVALIARARTSKSDKPHWHIIPDMDFQFKNKSQTASGMFADGRASRPPVAGTVARGELEEDDHFYRGIKDDKWAQSFPPVQHFPAHLRDPQKLVERGADRFEIYCRPCHGADGRGNGMVAQRAKRVPKGPKWTPPTDLHSDVVVKQPHGQIFNTISNGIRNMPAYAAQIDEEDRWAIVLYVRALQRSQNASTSDVPANQKIR